MCEKRNKQSIGFKLMIGETFKLKYFQNITVYTNAQKFQNFEAINQNKKLLCGV